MSVVCPDEFFMDAKRNGEFTPELEAAQKAFYEAQDQLFLDFYRKNMKLFTPKVIAETIGALEGVESDFYKSLLEN